MKDKNTERHPLMKKVRALQGEIATWRYNCAPEDIRPAMWLEDDISTLTTRIAALLYTEEKRKDNS